MKKLLTFLLVGVMLLTIAGGAFAEGPNNFARDFSEKPFKLSEKPFEIRARENLRFEAMKEFKDELHKINQLRIERLSLRMQIIEKHDTLLDLYIEARENGNVEALKEAREVRKQVREINREIKDLFKQIRSERKAFREDVKNNDFDSAREHINKVIELKTLINEKISEKIVLLDEVIDILS
ncbi:hypothetical protein TR13x_06205 [Caloranaerobacter sp. TR13]|uniref:hypothetical protein n=1 Tax=Caloranaerobacter sp. TR13 TaxID=1302151 RepID=UPI0006D46738|nr:hypothetical protein [Caloranaerobacter sp. TR13]KPU27152.1 hypothetical protein TR13x_06205 [Caloranaerobacter sp. TR13]